MNKKATILLLLILSVIGSSCNSTSVLVRNQVITRTTDGVQENNWSQKQAKEQISLKALRVLVVDATNTKNEMPYKEPFLWRMQADEPIKVDSVIESAYYNRIVLHSFRNQLPQKADLWIVTQQMSPETLDSLVRADRYDAVISAQQIKFDYQYFFVGMKGLDTMPKDRGVIRVGNSYRSIVGATEKPTMANKLVFREPLPRRQPPTQGRTLVYSSVWTLQRTTPGQGIDKQKTIHIEQEGVRTNTVDSYWEIMFVTTAQEAGESLAKIFSW